ncbi:MAG: MaoC/PaaZ C-terminal domain-containing protein [Tepidiformaceae bacterium]
MTAQRFIEDVAEGDAIPAMVKNASRAQLFLFSAATNNPHRIHYDREYAATEGHPDVLVHGPLQGAWLSQFVSDWIGPRGRMLSLTLQNRGRAFPESDLTFKGFVKAIHPRDVVELEVWEEDASGQVLMPGTAKIRLPRRE